MTSTLEIVDLHVTVGGADILRGLDLTVRSGETHALMGPNGSGKSTLAYAIMGHPRYEVTSGSIRLDGVDVTELAPDERARAGLFLAMQYPTEVPGVSVSNLLRTALGRRRGADVPVRAFVKELLAAMKALEIDPAFAERSVNEGFSGGERKRQEILQMLMFEPPIAVLDETDSGLDVDALRIVTKGIDALRAKGTGVLLITHFTRILQYLRPDFVHVMVDGRVVEEGGPELARRIEDEGYEHYERLATTEAREV